MATTLNPPVRALRKRRDVEDPLPPLPPRQGDLDDVPDDYELNSEGFRLPPMSSDSSDGVPSIVASSLLRHPDKSYIKLEVISAKEVRSLLVFFNWFIVAAFLYTILLLIAANTAHKFVQDVAIAPEYLTEAQKENATTLPAALAAQVLTRTSSHFEPQLKSPPPHAIFSERPPPCEAPHTTHSSIAASSSERQPLTFDALATTMRQVPDLPIPDGEEGAFPDDDMFDPDSLPPLGAADLPGVDDDDLIFLIPEKVSVLPRAYKLVSHVSNLFLALFFFVLSILFAIRVFSQGKRKVTHEQIWVLILMLSTSFYFSAFESIIRVFAEGSFLCSCHVLLHLGQSAFVQNPGPPEEAPIQVVLPAQAFDSCSAHYLHGGHLHCDPSAAQILPAMRAELAAAIVKSLIDLILLVIIVLEAKKTFKVLEEAPYMKHRTKRFMLLFGKPKGDNFVTLSPNVTRFSADLFHFWTVGPNILLTGYVLVTAYVHLPRTSVGVIKGWFLASKLAKSGSTYPRRSEEDSDGMTSVTRSADDDITRSTIAKKAWNGDHLIVDDDSLDNDRPPPNQGELFHDADARDYV
ncbi:Lipase domain protein [Gracilaria domingensis]|nr:Lipase domain protein [Gracilaria domingensis]